VVRVGKSESGFFGVGVETKSRGQGGGQPFHLAHNSLTLDLPLRKYHLFSNCANGTQRPTVSLSRQKWKLART
jgi:hypothetical protein